MAGIKIKKYGNCIRVVTAMIIATVMVSLIATDIHAQKPTKKIGVFVNPRDKQKTVGYTRIGLVWGQLFRPAQDIQRSIINLKEAMNKYTKIETDMEDHLELASNDLFEMPIIFVMSNDNVELTPTERENLKKYVELGGLIVVDFHQFQDRRPNAKSGDSLKQMLKEVIPNARFEPLSNSHPLYHSFFDFHDGPPLGAETSVSKSFYDNKDKPKEITGSISSKQINYLEGVYYKGRLAAIVSEKGYGVRWAEMTGSEPQLRMGVNMIMFALTQEGGIASLY